jgi:uncharacterized damage-inducible protein DinB
VFTKDGIGELHARTHECLDILLQHVSAVQTEMLRTKLAGFGIPTIWLQLTHILEVEEGWVLNLQDQPRSLWREGDCATMATLRQAKERVRDATRTYLGSLNETELNAQLAKRPKEWAGELRSPAFILLHVVTHTFHHKGQIVSMLRTIGYPAPDTDLQRS